MASSYSSCGGVLPAAAANQPPKLSVSSTNGRGMFSSGGVSSAIAINASASASPRCLKLMGFNGKPITSITSVRFRCNSQLLADFAPATAAAYGALLSSGGLFAYRRSGSKGSLIGGLTGGSLMAAAYFLMQATNMKEIGEALAFGSTLLFASVFGIRLAATRKITPAGPLLGLSICALVVFISAYLQESL